MKRRNPYAHGADLSVYPTVEVMIDAYVHGYYRTYPHQAHCPIGPHPEIPPGAPAFVIPQLLEAREKAHAVIVMPRRIVLARFARRAALKDIERLEHERALLEQTPEMAPVAHWRIELRLVHCDIGDGVEARAEEHGIRLALYRPRWLAIHRPRNVNSREHGIVLRRLTPQRLEKYAAAHDGPLARIADPAERRRIKARYIQDITPKQRQERNSKAMRTRWARLAAQERSEVNRERTLSRGDLTTAEQRSALARRLNDSRWGDDRARLARLTEQFLRLVKR